MSLTGSWYMNIATPLGSQFATLELTENEGTVKGVAKGDTLTGTSKAGRLPSSKVSGTRVAESGQQL